MFEGASLEARKYVSGYVTKRKRIERFEWRMVGISPSGKADWRYVVVAEEEKEVEVPIMSGAPIMRYGKTEKDHGRNAHGKRFLNRELRIAWDKEMRSAGARGSSRQAIKFPIEVCNGKRSRALNRVRKEKKQ